MSHRRKLRHRNFWKIYAMGAVQLFILELALDLLAIKHRFVRKVHWVGVIYPERKKYILRVLDLRLHIWVSVDTRQKKV
jgi:hypothetical protein